MELCALVSLIHGGKAASGGSLQTTNVPGRTESVNPDDEDAAAGVVEDMLLLVVVVMLGIRLVLWATKLAFEQ